MKYVLAVGIISLILTITMFCLALYYTEKAKKSFGSDKLNYDRCFNVCIGLFSASAFILLIDILYWWKTKNAYEGLATDSRMETYYELPEY
jgi:hypothetical protein